MKSVGRCSLALMLVLLCGHFSVVESARPENPIIPPPLKDLGRDYKARMVYFVPSDKEVKSGYQEKIEVLMRVVADMYHRDLNGKGHKTRGLDFEFDEDGKLKVHLVKGDRPSVFYTGEPFSVDRLLDSSTDEVIRKLGPPDNRACLIFSEAGGIAEAQPRTPHCGFAMVSADMLRDDVTATTIEGQINRFFDTTPVRKVDGQDMEPRMQTTQVTNGVLIHELGHIFFMLHDTSEIQRNIMAYGYHRLRMMYDPKTAKDSPVHFTPAHARVAAATRFFSESFDESDDEAPTIEFNVVEQPKPGDQKIKIALRLTDNAGLKAMICLQRGGGMVDALVGEAALEGKEFDEVLEFDIPRKYIANQPLIYIINVVDDNGNCMQEMQRSSVLPE